MGTPGPWKWWTSNSFRRLSSANKDGGVICPTVQLCDGHPDLIVSKEDMALIAAAPELLEALQECVYRIDSLIISGKATDLDRKHRDLCQAAINKALGKE